MNLLSIVYPDQTDNTTTYAFLAFGVAFSFILLAVSYPEWWPWTKYTLYRIWQWIVDPTYYWDDQPPVYDLNDRRGMSGAGIDWSKINIQYGGDKTKIPHVHVWEYFNTLQDRWHIEKGKPIGKNYDLDAVIKAKKEEPSHNETSLTLLENWRATGYDIVHISYIIYKCKFCNQTHRVESYTAPSYSDGRDQTIVIDFSRHRGVNDSFKKTQQITTVTTYGRREFAVEPMKRYGKKQPKPSGAVPESSGPTEEKTNEAPIVKA